MNCLDFRRVLQADPACRSPEFLRHKRACPECAPAVQRAARLEHLLRESLRVEVPEGLTSRVLLRHALRARPHPRRGLTWALAASALLWIGVWGGLHWQVARLDSLENEVVSLVEGAGYTLAGVEPVAESRVARALGLVGMNAVGPLGRVTFASNCIVRGTLAGHLVIREEQRGPVTVFLIPTSLVTDRERIRQGRWRGVVVALPAGTLAVIGESQDMVAEIEGRIRDSVRWQST